MSAHALPSPSGLRRPRLLGRHSDDALRTLAADGDAAAFAELYERHHQALYRYCRSIVRHDEDARDALHNTWANAWAALRATDRDVPVRPWLFRIAHNEAISVLRRRRDHDDLDGVLDAASPDAAPEDDLALRQRLANLRADLAELPERQRSALLLRELSGLGHEEIAAVHGVTPSAAKQSIYEARRALLEAEEGRSMICADVQRQLSDGDGRVRRGRRMRAHLRGCDACAAFELALRRRPGDLACLAPALPAAAAAGLLGQLLGGSAAGGSGGAGAVASGASASGFSGASVAGTAGAGSAFSGAASSGLVAAGSKLGAGLAAKLAVGAVVAVGAGAGTVEVVQHRAAPATDARPAVTTPVTAGGAAPSGASPSGAGATVPSGSPATGATVSGARSHGQQGARKRAEHAADGNRDTAGPDAHAKGTAGQRNGRAKSTSGSQAAATKRGSSAPTSRSGGRAGAGSPASSTKDRAKRTTAPTRRGTTAPTRRKPATKPKPVSQPKAPKVPPVTAGQPATPDSSTSPPSRKPATVEAAPTTTSGKAPATSIDGVDAGSAQGAATDAIG